MKRTVLWIIVLVAAVGTLLLSFALFGWRRGSAREVRAELGALVANDKDNSIHLPAQAPKDRSTKPNESPIPSGVSEYISKFTPKYAASQLEKARKEKDLSVRAIKTSTILANLSENGYFQEAWNLIDPNYGIGRLAEIERVLGAGAIPVQEKIRLLGELSNQEDVAAGCSGFVGGFSTDELMRFEMNGLGVKTDLVRKGIARATAGKFIQEVNFYQTTKPPGYQETSSNLILRSIELANLGQIDVLRLKDIFTEQDASAFTRWSQIANLNVESKKGQVNDLRRHLIDGMILEDSAAAMKLVTALGTPDQANLISHTLRSWYRLDSGGANSWVGSNIQILPALQRDEVAATAARLALEDKDLDTANKWASAVIDDVKRQPVLAEIARRKEELNR